MDYVNFLKINGVETEELRRIPNSNTHPESNMNHNESQPEE